MIPTWGRRDGKKSTSRASFLAMYISVLFRDDIPRTILYLLGKGSFFVDEDGKLRHAAIRYHSLER